MTNKSITKALIDSLQRDPNIICVDTIEDETQNLLIITAKRNVTSEYLKRMKASERDAVKVAAELLDSFRLVQKVCWEIDTTTGESTVFYNLVSVEG